MTQVWNLNGAHYILFVKKLQLPIWFAFAKSLLELIEFETTASSIEELAKPYFSQHGRTFNIK